MKEENNQILKENLNYIMRNSKKYIFNQEEELPHIHNKGEPNKNPNPNNIKYINDTMRSHLMKAFTHFHPNIHLQNLKVLLTKDEDVRRYFFSV